MVRERILNPGKRKRGIGFEIDRRKLLVGGGVGAGLLVAWAFWPREFPANVTAGPGEHIFNSFLKIAEDGHITAVLPQIEMGQGAFTLLAQIIADELGADWRTIAIEPASLSPNYANSIVSDAWNDGLIDRALGGAARDVMPSTALQVTGSSSTVRALGPKVRHAGAAARILLCMAAAKRWDADWQACIATDGFVMRGADKARFGELAADAALLTPPDEIIYREGTEGRLVGKSLPRIDLPSKIDGSANYAADIRLPDMVFASIRMGPLGDTSVQNANRDAILKQPGINHVVVQDRWVAAVGKTWWAAERALVKVAPAFAQEGTVPDSAQVQNAFTSAFEKSPTIIAEEGDADTALGIGQLFSQTYSVNFAAHAAMEPTAATAIIRNSQIEVWLPTQVPGLARAAVARALGWSEESVVIHPVIVGGSFGRKYEVEAAAQVAIIAQEIGAPVQLIWSRAEDMAQDRFRPAAVARMTGHGEASGQVNAWRAHIAAPAYQSEMLARIRDGKSAYDAQRSFAAGIDPATVSGAAPSYAIPNLSVKHFGVDIGVPVGKWRSGADAATAFFNECFIDELAKHAGVDPFTFRMGLLSQNKRLAQCLNRVTMIGNWQGGVQGTAQGLACHSMLGSHVAVLAEARADEKQQIHVSKLIAVVDIGRCTHYDIAMQQIEGALIFGMASAIGNSVTVNKGVVSPSRMADLDLPVLAQTPDILIEILPSTEECGGVGEVAVPPVGPAIANAIHAGGGRRLRSLPLLPRSG